MEKKTNRKSSEIKRLIAALCVVIVIVGAMIIYLAMPLITGQTIVLATRPIDPFDVLRGQYININYEISQIPLLKGVKAGDKIFVVLQEDKEGIWRYKQASSIKPDQGIFIKGLVQNPQGNSTWVHYGIEQYFLEKNAQLPSTNLTVRLKIDKAGRARILGLLYKGEPAQIYYQNPTLTS